MAVQAADVAKLRKLTGAGMMDCKKALEETNGDFEQAIDYLREKGQKVASKRADREASEGVVIAKISDDGKYGALIVLNCETDFVAKNKDFVALADNIAQKAVEVQPSDLDALKKIQLAQRTVEDEIAFQTGVIGEKLDLSQFKALVSECVVPYNHPGNQLASIIGFSKAVDQETGKDVAMQVAAMDPVSVSKDNVPEDVIERELKIGREQARQEGKPENMVEKIAQGRLNKFFQESTLLSQAFIKDSKLTVEQYIKSKDKELTVNMFIRHTLSV